MKANAIIAMTNAIKAYIKRNLPKEKDINRAVIGRVNGGRVIVGNNSYPYTPTVDVYFGSGDNVACLLPNSVNGAVVVGVV